MFAGLSDSCEIGGKRRDGGIDNVMMESPLLETLLDREHKDGAVLFAKLLVDWGKIKAAGRRARRKRVGGAYLTALNRSAGQVN